MNQAQRASSEVIERTLANNSAYRKLDDRLYIVKQGSTFVMMNVVAIGEHRAQVRCVAQLAKGVDMTGDLALELLTMNTRLRFGAFAYEPAGRIVLFTHSLLGGPTLDSEELIAALSDVAILADEYDDKIVEKYGGQTMKDLLEEAAIENILKDLDHSAFPN